MGFAFLSLVLCTTPNTLCIGDSITHGWAKHVKWDIPRDNCGSSRKFLERLDQWQQGKHWDTIIFNCGIHDIYTHVPLEEYTANLHTIIHRLHADHIYFCNITPGRVHEVRGVEPEKVKRYNDAALEVMRAEKIRVIDIYGPTMAHPEWWNHDIHYTADGYAHMAEIVQRAISQ